MPKPLSDNPFFFAWKSLPLPLEPFLTYLEIPPLCRGVNSRSLWSLVGCILNPPPSSPFTFPPTNGSPSQMHALLQRHCDIGFT